MQIVEFIILVLIAVVIGSIFFYGFKRGGPWNLLWIFLILFLVAWAGRLWIAPAGTIHWGLAWLPVIFWVLLIALLIAAASPGEDRRTAKRKLDNGEEVAETGSKIVFGVFFWLLLLALITMIVIGLFR